MPREDGAERGVARPLVVRAAADRIYAEFKSRGIDVLLDDRDMSPGVKFKDADLIGIPYRVTLGKKLAEGIAEVVERRGSVKHEVPVAEAVAVNLYWRRLFAETARFSHLKTGTLGSSSTVTVAAQPPTGDTTILPSTLTFTVTVTL